MNQDKIVLVGGGGHCKSCIDIIELENKYQIVGVIDLPELIRSKILDYDIIGNDDDIYRLAKEGYNFHITLGHLGRSKRRAELYKLIKLAGGHLPSIISPRAHIATHAKINDGTIIMHNSIVNTDASIGANCIINSKALIEHDVKIGNNCHIATDVNVNGDCEIGNNVFIGSGVTLRNGINICSDTIVGVGSLVLKSIITEGVYFGNPLVKS